MLTKRINKVFVMIVGTLSGVGISLEGITNHNYWRLLFGAAIIVLVLSIGLNFLRDEGGR